MNHGFGRAFDVTYIANSVQLSIEKGVTQLAVSHSLGDHVIHFEADSVDRIPVHQNPAQQYL